MNAYYKNSAVCVDGFLYEETRYDAGNTLLNAQFDGRGGVSRYAVINKFEALDFLRVLFSLNGRAFDYSEQKTVEMIGGKMTVKIKKDEADLEIRQFISPFDNAVFFRIGIFAKEDLEFQAVVNFGVDYKSYIQEFFLSRFKVSGLIKAAVGALKKHIKTTDFAIKNDVLGDFYIDFASDNKLEPMEKNFFFVNQFKTSLSVKEGEKKVITLVFSAGERGDFSSADAEELLKIADKKEKEADEYIEKLRKNAEKYASKTPNLNEKTTENYIKNDEKTAKNDIKNDEKTTENSVKNDENCIKNDEKTAENSVKNDENCIKNNEKTVENDEKNAKNCIKNGEKNTENDEKEYLEMQKALYVSCLNCAASNYKEKGKFKALLAGIVYQFPARTYFRDGYWTALPLVAVRPDIVRNQILTLARGIGKRGECPSAVKSTFKNYWGNHYDSPSFFVMLLHDYAANSGDFSIFSEKIRGKSVLNCAELVVRRLEAETDETGLLVKSGKFNRRDWCDNVFRAGYATYDEALYARALYCMSDIFSALSENETDECGNHKNRSGKAENGYKKTEINEYENHKNECGKAEINDGENHNKEKSEKEKTNGYECHKEKSESYKNKYEKVKKAINDILFDEKKGYFVNYKDGDFVEDNLSIDTVTVALFGLSTEERIERTLKNMEKILESKNNSEQVLGDFGVLSVYPFYRAEAVVDKSSLPYYYHNGGDWPYLSAAYAYAKMIFGMDYQYPLTRWFDYNVKKGNFTPVEFFSPAHKDGSLMQGWSAMGAFLFHHRDGKFFENRIDKRDKNMYNEGKG
jgi:glycogen debranching enzyme